MSNEEEQNGNEIVVRVKKDENPQNNSEEVERLRSENEELAEKISLVAQKEFERKKKELGCTDDSIQDPESLLAWKKGKESTTGGQAAGGSAPLNDKQQFGANDSFTKKQFNSPKEMVDELKLRMHSDNPEVAAEARSIYEILLQKAIRQGGTGQSESVGLKELVRKPKKQGD
jgi:hypothetical protein